MALLLNVIVAAALVLALSSASVLLGPPRRLEGDRGLPYETGLPPMDAAAHRMSVPYVRHAVLFVIFDVELAFFIPWAAFRRRMDLGDMAALTALAAVFALTLAYVWKKGALELE